MSARGAAATLRSRIPSSATALTLALAIAVAIASSAAGQATQPVETSQSKNAWPATLAAFAAALLDASSPSPSSSSSAAIEPFLCQEPLIQQFNRSQRETTASLLEQVAGGKVIASRAYGQ